MISFIVFLVASTEPTSAGIVLGSSKFGLLSGTLCLPFNGFMEKEAWSCGDIAMQRLHALKALIDQDISLYQVEPGYFPAPPWEVRG